MKKLMWSVAALALIAVGPARGDIVYKPIDTNKLVVKPSNAAANIAAKTIGVVGNTAAGSIEKNGWVKTVNNLFSKKIHTPSTQGGPSSLPTPNLFPSTQYKSFNTPVMPINAPRR
jgi:hypothetical protein